MHKLGIILSYHTAKQMVMGLLNTHSKLCADEVNNGFIFFMEWISG